MTHTRPCQSTDTAFPAQSKPGIKPRMPALESSYDSFAWIYGDPYQHATLWQSWDGINVKLPRG
jgi:hypothetical protein